MEHWISWNVVSVLSRHMWRTLSRRSKLVHSRSCPMFNICRSCRCGSGSVHSCNMSSSSSGTSSWKSWKILCRLCFEHRHEAYCVQGCIWRQALSIVLHVNVIEKNQICPSRKFIEVADLSYILLSIWELTLLNHEFEIQWDEIMVVMKISPSILLWITSRRTQRFRSNKSDLHVISVSSLSCISEIDIIWLGDRYVTPWKFSQYQTDDHWKRYDVRFHNSKNITFKWHTQTKNIYKRLLIKLLTSTTSRCFVKTCEWLDEACGLQDQGFFQRFFFFSPHSRSSWFFSVWRTHFHSGHDVSYDMSIWIRKRKLWNVKRNDGVSVSSLHFFVLSLTELHNYTSRSSWSSVLKNINKKYRRIYERESRRPSVVSRIELKKKAVARKNY